MANTNGIYWKEMQNQTIPSAQMVIASLGNLSNAWQATGASTNALLDEWIKRQDRIDLKNKRSATQILLNQLHQADSLQDRDMMTRAGARDLAHVRNMLGGAEIDEKAYNEALADWDNGINNRFLAGDALKLSNQEAQNDLRNYYQAIANNDTNAIEALMKKGNLPLTYYGPMAESVSQMRQTNLANQRYEDNLAYDRAVQKEAFEFAQNTLENDSKLNLEKAFQNNLRHITGEYGKVAQEINTTMISAGYASPEQLHADLKSGNALRVARANATLDAMTGIGAKVNLTREQLLNASDGTSFLGLFNPNESSNYNPVRDMNLNKNSNPVGLNEPTASAVRRDAVPNQVIPSESQVSSLSPENRNAFRDLVNADIGRFIPKERVPYRPDAVEPTIPLRRGVSNSVIQTYPTQEELITDSAVETSKEIKPTKEIDYSVGAKMSQLRTNPQETSSYIHSLAGMLGTDNPQVKELIDRHKININPKDVSYLSGQKYGQSLSEEERVLKNDSISKVDKYHKNAIKAAYDDQYTIKHSGTGKSFNFRELYGTPLEQGDTEVVNRFVELAANGNHKTAVKNFMDKYFPKESNKWFGDGALGALVDSSFSKKVEDGLHRLIQDGQARELLPLIINQIKKERVIDGDDFTKFGMDKDGAKSIEALFGVLEDSKNLVKLEQLERDAKQAQIDSIVSPDLFHAIAGSDNAYLSSDEVLYNTFGGPEAKQNIINYNLIKDKGKSFYEKNPSWGMIERQIDGLNKDYSKYIHNNSNYFGLESSMTGANKVDKPKKLKINMNDWQKLVYAFQGGDKQAEKIIDKLYKHNLYEIVGN